MNFLMFEVLASVSRPYRNLKPFEFADMHYPYPEKMITLPNGIEIAYVSVGQGAETIVMLHGLGSYLPGWSPLIERLKRKYRCIALDLPGYGKSSKGPFDIGIHWYAEQVKALVEKLGLKRFHLMGHSMGGQISIDFTVNYPELVEKLVLLAPAGFETFNAAEKKWFNGSLTALTVKMTSPAQIRTNFANNFYKMPDSVEFMVQDRINMRGASDFPLYCNNVAKCVMAMVDEPIFHLLPKISRPTLVIYGENDKLIPNKFIHGGTTRKIAQTGAAQIPNSQLVMFNECGHFITIEQPDLGGETIRQFLGT